MMINQISRLLGSPPPNFKSARGVNASALLPVAKKPQRTDKEINYIKNWGLKDETNFSTSSVSLR